MAPGAASILVDRPLEPEVVDLVVRLARENSGWGYDCIVGALQILGHHCPAQKLHKH